LDRVLRENSYLGSSTFAGQLPPQAGGRGSHAQATDRYTRQAPSTTAGRDIRPPPNYTAAKKGIATMLTCVPEEKSKKSSQLYLSTPLSVRSHATPRRDIDDRPAEFSMFESKRVREYPSGAPRIKKVKLSAFSKPQPPKSKTSEEAITSSSGDRGRNVAATKSANTSLSSIFNVPSAFASTQEASLDGADDDPPNSGAKQTSRADNFRNSYYGPSL
jgi:hypothetical protein